MEILGYDIKIGADPEFFVAQKGKPVSAHGLIKGDKKNPLKVNKGAVQVDGMALEFNIDPAANAKEFDENLTEVMRIIQEMVPGYDYFPDPVAHFGKAYIDGQPLEAKILGCEPDYNAYTGAVNPTPNAETPFRSAAGHIHVGWCENVDPMDPGHFEACRMMTKALDKHLGLLSVLWDTDQDRRKLYGKAGCFRPKPYGMEYRTLSNAWLSRKPLIRKLIHGNVMEAFRDCMENPAYFEGPLDDIRNAVDKGVSSQKDEDKVLELIQNLGVKTVQDYKD